MVVYFLSWFWLPCRDRNWWGRCLLHNWFIQLDSGLWAFFSDGVTANKSENDADSHAEVQQGKTSIFDSVMSFLWKLWLIFWAVLFIGIFLLIYFDD